MVDAKWGDVLPLKEDSDRDSFHGGTTRRGLPFAGDRRPGYLEARRRRAVVGTKSDHGNGRGIAGRYAVSLGLAVRYRSQRVRARSVELRRATRKIGAEHPVRRLNGC